MHPRPPIPHAPGLLLGAAILVMGGALILAGVVLADRAERRTSVLEVAQLADRHGAPGP